MGTSEWHIPDMIAAKRDGEVLSTESIKAFVIGAANGEIVGEQLGAMLMAIMLRGMDPRETADLTEQMIDSGIRLEWPENAKGRVADKHSTGGVGDKVSLPLAPALAACGALIPMISGRGLGHTGGTLDKLEAIPGLTTQLSVSDLQQQVLKIGCAIVGQTDELVPADRRLYAIRDVTATVASIPLITASIVSKKIAEGLNALVLDVKFGRAAFMQEYNAAKELAESMVKSATRLGVHTTALLTRMDQPVGFSIGNALEIRETIDCLTGKGPNDLKRLVQAQGAEILTGIGIADHHEHGVKKIRTSIEDGSAMSRFLAMISAQGASFEDAESLLSALPVAQDIRMIMSPRNGWVSDIDALHLGRLAGALGAGRATPNDRINPSVGLVLSSQVGDWLNEGDPLIEIHAEKDASSHEKKALEAFTFVDEEPSPSDLICGRITT